MNNMEDRSFEKETSMWQQRRPKRERLVVFASVVRIHSLEIYICRRTPVTSCPTLVSSTRPLLSPARTRLLSRYTAYNDCYDYDDHDENHELYTDIPSSAVSLLRTDLASMILTPSCSNTSSTSQHGGGRGGHIFPIKAGRRRISMGANPAIDDNWLG
ncbi:hypothetical protein CSPX01_03050 [Colletotrichum filicis]|nr:hypothetical protein CSPX01_03050 [Colletotrichum filicis]